VLACTVSTQERFAVAKGLISLQRDIKLGAYTCYLESYLGVEVTAVAMRALERASWSTANTRRQGQHHKVRRTTIESHKGLGWPRPDEAQSRDMSVKPLVVGIKIVHATFLVAFGSSHVHLVPGGFSCRSLVALAGGEGWSLKLIPVHSGLCHSALQQNFNPDVVQ